MKKELFKPVVLYEDFAIVPLRIWRKILKELKEAK
jgi:hypothetical protein